MYKRILKQACYRVQESFVKKAKTKIDVYTVIKFLKSTQVLKFKEMHQVIKDTEADNFFEINSLVLHL